MTDEAAMTRNRRDGDVAFPAEVGKSFLKARIGLVGEKLGATGWHLLTLRSGVGNHEKRTMVQWVDSHQMEEAALVVACRWVAQDEAAQGWLCWGGHCRVASEPTVPVMEKYNRLSRVFGRLWFRKGRHGSKNDGQ